ncbi:MAG: caspase family protein [Gammaproteobacteria bacterium]|nr:caspase family protein [Gammaproteobacteria bacterium]
MKAFFSVSILIFSLFFFFQLEAKTLHAILVVDTVHDIKNVTQTDLKRWQKELSLVSQHTGMVLKERVFSGQNFAKEQIRNYLRNLKVSSEDSVIFYFSGHGYRTSDKQGRWPIITFEFFKPGLDVEWIAETIRNKKPQFALIFTDCCNNYLERGFDNPTKNIIINLKDGFAHYPGYAQLFCHAKGCVVVSSCDKGQFSYGSHYGGLFTQCFFSSLNRELSEKKPSWKNLVQRASGYIRNVQTPICEIYL